MRICFFAGNMNLGGIGKLTLNLAREFLKKGIAVDMFLLKGGGEYLEQIPKEVRVFVAEGSNFKRLFKFISYLNREKPDISISARQRQDIVNIFSCVVSGSQTEPIVSVHTNLTEELKHEVKEVSFFPFLARLFYKVPQKIIAVSNGVAKDFSQRTGVKQNKVEVIHNPVYTGNIIYEETTVEGYIDFINNRNFIISAGRFTEQKDLFTLLNALSNVRKTRDISLVLLGDGPLRDKIKRHIELLSLEKYVFFTGYVQNPLYYLKDASMYVLASKWEGFGNVLVEAMGVGTPVVSTNCPSGPAEILQNGKYGKLVPVEDSSSMAKAIIETLDNPVPSKYLKKRANDFAVSKIADKYLSLFNS